MTEIPIHRSRDLGALSPEDAVHLLAGLRSLLAEDLDVDSKRRLSAGLCICRPAASVIPFAAGLALAQDVAARAVAGLHDPEVPSLVAPILATVLSVVSPGTLTLEHSPERNPDTCLPVGALTWPRDGRYEKKAPGLPDFTVDGRLVNGDFDARLASLLHFRSGKDESGGVAS